jgi:hypothetical protein
MISIITSIYKSEKYIQKFLKNIQIFSSELSQSNIPHEFLILPNDPSELENKMLSNAGTINKNIKIIPRVREPLYATWNYGIRSSTYPFITFWNVDDIRFSEAIKDALSVGQSDSPVVIYFPFIYKRYINLLGIDFLVKSKIIDPAEFESHRFQKEMHIGPFFIATKKAFEKNGMFDASFKIAGDFDWEARGARAGLDFKKINTVSGIFKNNGKSLSGCRDLRQQDENLRIFNKIT